MKRKTFYSIVSRTPLSWIDKTPHCLV